MRRGVRVRPRSGAAAAVGAVPGDGPGRRVPGTAASRPAREAAHPAFGRHLSLDGIAGGHHAHCRGLKAAGAAVPILDWAAHIAGGTAARPRQGHPDGFMEPKHALHLRPSGSS
ncbi:hypothetical protein GCM10010249_16710 [Streptomyces roseolilacinus]|uniref:Uncharacterized protein n=1 Tax=Streptomyces roseolilacinus TaxID=66904 RepID=A0A918AY18_9ACTN|nr:hypothetical protein GCM10010249_16710 [Streptomyces roseolilacinus]